VATPVTTIQKRVLIITYYWPPSGGSGVQRWLKFAKYLPEAGWEPVIFTPENPDFDLQDETLLKEISPNLEVIRFPIWEPYQLFAKVKKKGKSHPGRILEQQKKGFLEKVAIWLRANILVPDPRVFWVKPSVQFLNELLKEGQFQAIITTGPPHSLHLIGQQLKQKHGIPWLADFRDPWSQWEFLDTLPMFAFIRRRHEALERKVLQQADVVVTISPTFQRDLEKLSGRKIDLITNGYDPADIPQDFAPRPKAVDRLQLVYTGIIDAIRNPLPLMQALKAEFEAAGEEVSWTFVGKVSEQVQQHVQADPWLQRHIHFAGYVSHQEVFDFYAKADALVLILTDTKNAKGSGETVLLWTYNLKPEFNLLSDHQIQQWIKDYMVANCKMIIGEAREKFATIAGPQGGGALNGGAMKSEAKTEMDALIEQLKMYVDGSQPLTWVIG
jgi:glycosyltransferase involved in cell wall biosynthesis